MPVQVHCKCGKQFRTSGKHVGKFIRCPLCGGIVHVPRDAPAASQEKETSAADALASLAGTTAPPASPETPAPPATGKPAEKKAKPASKKTPRQRGRRQARGENAKLPPPPQRRPRTLPPADLAPVDVEPEPPTPRPPQSNDFQPPAAEASAALEELATETTDAAPKPPPRPRAPRAPRPGALLGAMCGVAMLVTLLLPWGVTRTGAAAGGSPEGYRLVMAWDRLGAGTITAPWMVFCWVVGAVVLVTAPVVPTSRVRGIVLVSLGLPTAVFAMTMIAFLSAAKLPVGPVLEALFGERAALTAILWLLLTLMAATGHLSGRLEHRPGVRLAAMVPAALMALLALGAAITHLAALSAPAGDTPEAARWSVTSTLVMILANYMLAASGALVCLAALGRRGRRATGPIGLALGYLGAAIPALALLALSLTHPGGAVGMWMLLATNILLLLAAGFVLLGGGVFTLAASLLTERRPAEADPDEAPADARLMTRFRRLAELREQELITDDEHEQKRQQLLGEL